MIFALKDQHLRFFSSTGNSMSISRIVNNTKCNMVREIKRPDRVSNPVPLNLYVSTSNLDRDLAWLYIRTDVFKPRQISARINTVH